MNQRRRFPTDSPAPTPLTRQAVIRERKTNTIYTIDGGNHPAENTLARELEVGDIVTVQWSATANMWHIISAGALDAASLRVVALSQQYASGLFAIHPTLNWIVSYYASGGTTTLYAHPVDWSGADPVFGTPATLGIADSGFIVGASALNFDSTGAWLILTGPWTTHTLRTFSFDDTTGAMAAVQDVGSGTFPQTNTAHACHCPDSHLAVSVSGSGEVRIYHFDNGTGNVTTTAVDTLTGTAASPLWGADYNWPALGDTEYLYLSAALPEVYPFDRSSETAGAAIAFPNLPFIPATGWAVMPHGGEITLLAVVAGVAGASAIWTWDFNPTTGVITGPFYNVRSPISGVYSLIDTRFNFTTAQFIQSGLTAILFVSVDLISREITFTAYAEPSTPLSATRDFGGYLVRANVAEGDKLELLASFLP